jgi:hypothetical protein
MAGIEQRFPRPAHPWPAGVVAAAVVIPVVSLFVTRTSAKIAAGSYVTGFVEENVPVVFSEATPAPLAVTTP